MSLVIPIVYQSICCSDCFVIRNLEIGWIIWIDSIIDLVYSIWTDYSNNSLFIIVLSLESMWLLFYDCNCCHPDWISSDSELLDYRTYSHHSNRIDSIFWFIIPIFRTWE